HGRQLPVADDVRVPLVHDGVADDAGAGPADAALGGRGGDAVRVADGPDAEQGLARAPPLGVLQVVEGAVEGAEARAEQAAFLQQLRLRPEATAARPSFPVGRS